MSKSPSDRTWKIRVQASRVRLLYSISFLSAFLTATLAGVQWLNKDPFELGNFHYGLSYSALLILVLACHEFGHYFAARIHSLDVTPPLFIPFPSIGVLALVNPFGTLGAVIRLRAPIGSRKALFDIGAAGPISGFIASFVILAVGFGTLPPKEYLYSIHPEYAQMDRIPEGGWVFGQSFVFSLVESIAVPSNAFMPPMNEIYHYPLLCVGWFGLLVTGINLIPVGQLDGGHISYAMFGNRYHTIAQISIALLIGLGLAGLLPEFGIPFSYGYTGWLFWAILLILSIRVMKLNRPPIADETPLDPSRTLIGWICIFIFFGCFSLTPFRFIIP